MSTETDFLNLALSKIGAAEITQIDDGTVNANHSKHLYPPLRRAMIESNNWVFATDRAFLAPDVSAPIPFGWTFAYILPINYLKPLEYNGANTTFANPDFWRILEMFKVEGRRLLSNDGSVALTFLKDVTDPSLWSALFFQFLAAMLASQLALAIPKDSRMSASLLQEATGMWSPMATAVDGQVNPARPFIVDDLTWGR